MRKRCKFWDCTAFFIHYTQNNNAPKRHKWLFEETGNKTLLKENGYLLSNK
jgi:hypothetical protein